MNTQATMKGAGASARAAAAAAGPAPPDFPLVPKAKIRLRHIVIITCFVLGVLVPSLVSAWYLTFRAVDRYVSHLAFSVRSDVRESGTDFGGAAYRDLDVIRVYLHSPEIVAILEERLAVGAHYSAPHDRDPFFALHRNWTREDLVNHWRWMLRVAYEPARGIIALRIDAFSPEMAHQIAHVILEEATRVINDMSTISREELTRYALVDLDRAQERLRGARAAFTTFRSTARVVDPAADLDGLNALIASLQGQLAIALIDLDLLRETTRPDDPRIATAEREIAAVRARIEDERSRFTLAGEARGAPASYASLYAEFEQLRLEREFAEMTYASAGTALAAAQTRSLLQARYVVAHVQPTIAERPALPERFALWGLLTLFCLLFWSFCVVFYYGMRDST
jgi:capsular polysaccharide transport system permease protein